MSTHLEERAIAVPATADSRFLWNEIVRWTFEACILRKEGREEEVGGLLQERLPELIRAWSRRCGLSAEACKEQLRALFNRAQEAVEFGCIQRRLIVEELFRRLRGPAGPHSPGPRETLIDPAPSRVRLRRRVPIGDVPGMLDALAEAEFETFGEAVLPLRRAVTPPPDCLAESSGAPLALSA